MYASRTTQLIVGIFALLGIAALAFLSLSLGQLELLPAPGYTLFANFDTIAGLKAGDQVEIAGVKVGKVTAAVLKDDRAHVTLRINQGVAIDDEAFAAIKSSGLIGDKFVSIALGPGDHTLGDQGVIRHTQSAVVLEDLIGQLINSGGSGGGSTTGGGANTGSSGISAPPAAEKK
jgi:phospholipid/cholesterol/gamma-HCH transport system substrate-binding protein